MQAAIMIEGQNGLTWPHWQRIAQLAEDMGFAGLYRSDHFTNANPPDIDSLECWVSLTWLASHTKRIEFGPLVSPFSFRHPTLTARMAASIDDLSGGRLHLGLGAGWQEREHNLFGWDLLPIPERFRRFEEGIEVVQSLLDSEVPVHYEGKYYQLRGATLLPRPQRPGGPQIRIGGNGLRRTLPLAVKYASEWNGIYLTPDRLSELNKHLDELLVANGRVPADLKRSMMTGLFFGENEHDVARLAENRNRSIDEIRQAGAIIGTANQVVEQLGQLTEAGVYRVMLQWLDLNDMDRLERFAALVLPQLG